LPAEDKVASELVLKRAKGIRTAIMIAAVVVVLCYLPLTANLFFFSVVENFANDVARELRAPAPPRT